ncbi:MAG: polyprenyl synthetase family protein [Armatimonadetes bacterium]|nr:polyprenyl synthetase family protein [Armatimonadota bacterium]
MKTKSAFFDYLEETSLQVSEFLRAEFESVTIGSPDLRSYFWAYFDRGGKRLRPAVVRACAGAVGADPDAVMPAAAAVEVFHTWTLVHDDVIDGDSVRRGLPTVHELASTYSVSTFGASSRDAADFGRNSAILTGDAQHGWAVVLLAKLLETAPQIDPRVVVSLIRRLESDVVWKLLDGEHRDVMYGMFSDRTVTESEVIEMLWLKTGVLYEFSALMGASLGLNTTDVKHPQVAALAAFASQCGTAFQLQDDILGILGEPAETGKPRGNDIREGKKTTIVLHALSVASDSQRAQIEAVLGNRSASSADVDGISQLFVDLGSVGRTDAMAKRMVAEASPLLDVIEESRYKQLLLDWAAFLVDRSF